MLIVFMLLISDAVLFELLLLEHGCARVCVCVDVRRPRVRFGHDDGPVEGKDS